jgi:hypothetical protein
MKTIDARLEYYNSLGPLVNFDPPCQQKQQIVRFAITTNVIDHDD